MNLANEDQSRIEKLYGDRIETFDESKYKSGEELEKGTLEEFDKYLSQQQCEMIINSSVKVVEPPLNYDSNHNLTKEQRLKKAAEILDIDEYNAELDIINGDVKSFTDVQESIKWLRGEVE